MSVQDECHILQVGSIVQAILDGLKFDEGRKKWTALYTFFTPPSELRDNSHQVESYTENMDKKTHQAEQSSEFSP